MTKNLPEIQSATPSEVTALKVKLEEAEARYAKAARDLDRLRKTMAKVGGSSSSSELRRLHRELASIKGSTVWRVSAPLRLAMDMVRRPRLIAAKLGPLYALVRQSRRDRRLACHAAQDQIEDFAAPGSADRSRCGACGAPAACPLRSGGHVAVGAACASYRRDHAAAMLPNTE